MAFVYVDSKKVLSLLGQSPMASEELYEPAMNLISMIGIDKWKSFSYGLSFEGRAIVDRTFISTPQGHGGILASTKPSQKPLRSLNMAPESSFSYAGYRTEWTKIPAQLLEALGAFDEDLATEAKDFLKGLDEQLGFSILNDAIPSFGAESAMWIAEAPFGGIIPEIIVALEVSDKAKLEECLNKTQTRFGQEAPIKKMTFMGHEIGYVDLGPIINGSQNSMPGFGLKPSWMMANGFLYVALAPQTLKHHLVAARNQAPKMKSNRDMGEALAHLRRFNPRAGLDGISYTNLGESATALIDTAAPILQSIHFPEEVPLEMTQFPTTDIFRKHLFEPRRRTPLTRSVFSTRSIRRWAWCRALPWSEERWVRSAPSRPRARPTRRAPIWNCEKPNVRLVSARSKRLVGGWG